MEKLFNLYPELRGADINAVLEKDDEIYFAGGGFFNKVNKEGKLVEIISSHAKLEGSNEDFFDILFDGNIYEIEESSEYNGLLTFSSNASGFLSVFYYPHNKEFYVTPRIIKKAYKPAGDNKFIETKLPEFQEGDIEHFKWWLDKYKILSDKKETTD